MESDKACFPVNWTMFKKLFRKGGIYVCATDAKAKVAANIDSARFIWKGTKIFTAYDESAYCSKMIIGLEPFGYILC